MKMVAKITSSSLSTIEGTPVNQIFLPSMMFKTKFGTTDDIVLVRRESLL
jgi:hypothetical protein